MNEELKFETYLFIDRKKLVICVIKKKTFEVIFKEEKLLYDYNENSKFKIFCARNLSNIFNLESSL